MAKTLALALALLVGGQTPVPVATDTTTFTDAALGLSFTHPTAWTTVATPIPVAAKPPKGNRFKLPGGKKKDDKDDRAPEGMVTFAISGSAGAAPARLTIVRASFSDAPEKWQQLQADANRNLKRDVERQWQQEILGVPLLLTRIAYTQDGTATTTVTGLLYNAAPYKLLFRLTGPTSGFDGAQYQFTQAMETLRTTSENLPTAQEPGKPIAPPVVPTPDSKHSLRLRPKVVPQTAPLALNLSVGGRPMRLHVPLGWTLASTGADSATLAHAGLKERVVVKLYTAATAPRPTEALGAASRETLEGFKSVDLREDRPGTPNRAATPVYSVWRRGAGLKGPHTSLDAVVVAGDYYALFTFGAGAGEAPMEERRIVEGLLDAVSLEPAP